MRTRNLATTRPLAVALLVALLLVVPTLVQAAEVTYLVPPVEVKHKGSAKFVVLHLHDKVYQGDTIRTGFGGRVEITISHKRVFRIGQASTVELPQLQDTKDQGIKARFKLLLGRFWGGVIRPLHNLQVEHFQVQTATATIGVKGTSFGVDYTKQSKETRAVVIHGVVAAVPPATQVQAPQQIAGPQEIAGPHQISRAAWLVLVTRDQKVIIRPGQAPKSEPMTAADKADEWVRFNTKRDQQLAKEP